MRSSPLLVFVASLMPLGSVLALGQAEADSLARSFDVGSDPNAVAALRAASVYRPLTGTIGDNEVCKLDLTWTSASLGAHQYRTYGMKCLPDNNPQLSPAFRNRPGFKCHYPSADIPESSLQAECRANRNGQAKPPSAAAAMPPPAAAAGASSTSQGTKRPADNSQSGSDTKKNKGPARQDAHQDNFDKMWNDGNW